MRGKVQVLLFSLLSLLCEAAAFTASPKTFPTVPLSTNGYSISSRRTDSHVVTRKRVTRYQPTTQLFSIDRISTLISEESIQTTPIEQLSPETTLAVFIIGLIPFIWATIEFWRRIAVGASFGTGKDSVVIRRPDDVITIGEDGNPESSRGRRTLDRGALTVAYVLFAVAAGSVGIAVASVVMGPRPEM